MWSILKPSLHMVETCVLSKDGASERTQESDQRHNRSINPRTQQASESRQTPTEHALLTIDFGVIAMFLLISPCKEKKSIKCLFQRETKTDWLTGVLWKDA